MYLVDDKDYISLLAHLLDETLHAALKLASELRSGHERRQVKKIYLLAAQLIRHLIQSYTLGKPLRDGSFADAGLADETGIVLLSAVEDLDNALKLLGAAYHVVELPRSGAVCEVYAVIIQKLALGRLCALLRRLLRGGTAALSRSAAAIAEKPVQEREGRGLAVVVSLRVLAAVGLEAHIHKALNAV